MRSALFAINKGKMEARLKLVPHGDRAVDAVFENEISPETNRKVTALAAAVRAAMPEGVIGCRPAYRTLTVEYDPMKITYGQLCLFLRGLDFSAFASAVGKSVSIPVLYGGDCGADIEDVARHAGLSTEEVIKRHSAPDYRVYMLGFMPGFPYLGGLDPAIACPRRTTPRTHVPGGSVGIAGMQTGVYPEPSPGGWNIIGRTPLRLFDETGRRALLEAGDTVRFVPVTAEEFAAIEKEGVRQWPKN